MHKLMADKIKPTSFESRRNTPSTDVTSRQEQTVLQCKPMDFALGWCSSGWYTSQTKMTIVEVSIFSNLICVVFLSSSNRHHLGLVAP